MATRAGVLSASWGQVRGEQKSYAFQFVDLNDPGVMDGDLHRPVPERPDGAGDLLERFRVKFHPDVGHRYTTTSSTCSEGAFDVRFGSARRQTRQSPYSLWVCERSL